MRSLPIVPATPATPIIDGRTALSQTLSAPLAAQISAHLATAGPARCDHTTAGEPYSTTTGALVVEVLAGTTRHAVVTVIRVR